MASPGEPLARTLATCHLFRLPIEIRRRIYELAIGHHVVHPKRLHCDGDVDKKSPPQCACKHTPRYTYFQRDSTAQVAPLNRPAPNHVPHSRLALALTCRAILAESIDLLYSSSTFSLTHVPFRAIFLERPLPARCIAALRSVRLDIDHHLLDSARLLDSMPAPCRGRIRHLELVCPDASCCVHQRSVPQGPRWTQLCRSVASMTRLQSLTVALHGPHVPRGWQMMILRPLATIKHVPDFTVLVSWHQEHIDWHAENGNWPFALKRIQYETDE